MRPADEDLETIVEETHAQPVANQAGWQGVEDLAQGEAAGARHGDSHLLEVRGAPLEAPCALDNAVCHGRSTQRS